MRFVANRRLRCTAYLLRRQPRCGHPYLRRALLRPSPRFARADILSSRCMIAMRSLTCLISRASHGKPMGARSRPSRWMRSPVRYHMAGRRCATFCSTSPADGMGGCASDSGLDDPLDSEVEAMHSWTDLQPMRLKTRGWLRRIIDETTDEELASASQPMWTATPASMEVSVGAILTHIMLHERGHHGDVSTALSLLGAEPSNIDYLVYVFFRQRGRQTP